MKTGLSSLARANILKMHPYSSGKDEFSGAAEIYLDTNENPFGDNVVNRYPDPLQRALSSRIVELKNRQFGTALSGENIVLGNGSDELIDQLVRVFCEPGKDSLAYCPITFGMYQVVADLNDVRAVKVPLDERFDLDPEAILATAADCKLLFVCSPNNPTGNVMSREKVRQILECFAGVVVLDEAYVDFCPGESFLPLLAEYPRLVILQTFSKSWGMAGVRIGFAFGDPELIGLLRRVKMPYNIGSHKADFVLERLKDPDAVQADIRLLLQERERMARSFSGMSGLVEKVYPSQANFLLVRFSDAEAVFEQLKAHGIIVRDFSRHPEVPGCLRITIGTPAENNAVLDVLSKS